MSVARWLTAGLLAAALAVPAHAIVNPGQVAPAFTKSVLGSAPWPTATLSQFSGQVVVLYLVGYN